MTDLSPLDAAVLTAGIRARFIDGVNGLRMHLLEAGHEDPGRPCLLLHSRQVSATQISASTEAISRNSTRSRTDSQGCPCRR